MEVEENYCDVDLLGHCAFCRRGAASGSLTGIDGGGENERDINVPKAMLLPSFDHIWAYLAKSGAKREEQEEEESTVNYRFKTGVTTSVSGFQVIPPMCHSCGERILELDKLHKELMRKVEEIKEIVVESGASGIHSWRGQDLKRKLESSLLDPLVKATTIQFLNELVKASSTKWHGLEHGVKKEMESSHPDIDFCADFINEDEPENGSEDEDGSCETKSPNDNQDRSQEEGGATEESDSTSVHQVEEEESDDDISGCPTTSTLRNSIPIRKPSLEIKQNGKPGKENQRLSHSDPSTLKKFQCDICPKSYRYKTENGLIFHNIKVHGADSSPLNCTICGRQCSNFPNLSEHEKTHSTVKDFKCDRDNCKLSYTSKFRLWKHIRLVHLRPRVICKTCTKSFYSKGALDNHIKSVHLGVKHECSVCKAQLSTAYSLRGHMRIHTGEMPFSCPNCDKQFKTKSEVNGHVKRCQLLPPSPSNCLVPRRRSRAKGFKVNGFKCSFPECGTQTQFSSKKELLAHKKTIHGDCWKHFVCETCGKGFSSQQTLQRHNETVHLGLSIICELCGDGFGSSYALDKHLRIHSGERPYECHICGQKFRQQPHLTSHLKAHQEQGDKFQPRGSREQKRRRRGGQASVIE